MTNALATREQAAPLMSFDEIKERAAMALRSGLLPPSIKSPEQAAIVGLKGQELGLPLMQSFESIHVIQGRPSVATETMLALAYERVAGFVFRVVETTSEKCVVEMGRGGTFTFKSAFTIAEARAAGLTGKDNWQKQPAVMLRWRAIGAALKVVCPDLRRNTWTVEEMEEVGAAHAMASARATDSLNDALGSAPAAEPRVIEAERAPAAAEVPTAPAPALPAPSTETEAMRRDLMRLAKEGGAADLARVSKVLGYPSGRRWGEIPAEHIRALWRHTLGGEPLPAPTASLTPDDSPEGQALNARLDEIGF